MAPTSALRPTVHIWPRSAAHASTGSGLEESGIEQTRPGRRVHPVEERVRLLRRYLHSAWLSAAGVYRPSEPVGRVEEFHQSRMADAEQLHVSTLLGGDEGAGGSPPTMKRLSARSGQTSTLPRKGSAACTDWSSASFCKAVRARQVGMALKETGSNRPESSITPRKPPLATVWPVPGSAASKQAVSDNGQDWQQAGGAEKAPGLGSIRSS